MAYILANTIVFLYIIMWLFLIPSTVTKPIVMYMISFIYIYAWRSTRARLFSNAMQMTPQCKPYILVMLCRCYYEMYTKIDIWILLFGHSMKMTLSEVRHINPICFVNLCRWYYYNIIVFSWGNCFPIVLSAGVYLTR